MAFIQIRIMALSLGFLAICALLLVLLPSLSFANTTLKDKRVLYLNAYDAAFPTYSRRIAGINSVFAGTGAIIDIEFMDSKRHVDAETTKRYLSLLKHKLHLRPKYDVIITSDDNALSLALTHRNDLFLGIPIIFNGLNDEVLAETLDADDQVTGVAEGVSSFGNLKLIRDIMPERDTLHVIVDNTPSGQADLERIRKAHQHFPHFILNIIDLETLSWDELATHLRELDENDAILLLSAFRDQLDKTLLFEESLALIRQHAEVPIYHMWEHGLGQGILGGILINQFEQARESALMAVAVLTGTPIVELPVHTQSTNMPMFDWRELERFEVDNSLLPANSQILFKPLSIWDTYRNELISLTVLFITLLLSSVYLARESMLRTRLANISERQSNFLRSVMNTVPDLIWLKDPQGKYLSCNSRFEQLYAAHEGEILGKTDFDYVSPELAQMFRRHDKLAIERNGPSRNEEWVTFKSDGQRALLETIKTPLKTPNGELIGVLGISRDITERTTAENKIRTLQQAVEQSPVSVVISNMEGEIEYVNRRFEMSSGYTQEEVIGNKACFLNPEETLSGNYLAMWQAIQHGINWEGELDSKHKQGSIFWEYAYVSPIKSDEGTTTGYLFVKEDITLRRKQEEKIRFQAHFDSLTGLPNRALSQDRLQQMIKVAKRTHKTVGVMYIDLDDFKKVNDTLGHDTGDMLLKEVGQCLLHLVRDGDTVGRLGGDEFIILINGMENVIDGGRIASALIEELERPIILDERQILVSASIGVTLYPQDGVLSGDLMRKADLAMYHAKQVGGSRFAFFTSELNEQVERRFLVEQQLRGALDRKEFYLMYQPKVRASTGEVTGFEALLRWENLGLGLVSPIEFIPIAEQSGAIVGIGQFVIESALSTLKNLTHTFAQDFTMSINLSPRQFRDEHLETMITALLDLHGISPHHVEFEITEGLFIDEPAGVQETLNRLHETGVKFAMDDFGKGYSSLSYLRHYPFDTLKIDREFIQAINENSADAELVNAAISMAHNLGLEVVAEGVETTRQLETLRALSCDIIQGYYYSKPVFEADIEATINTIQKQ